MTGAATMTTPKKNAKRQDTSVKIEDAIADQARIVCAIRKITMAEFLSDLLRVPVAREFAKTRKDFGSQE